MRKGSAPSLKWWESKKTQSGTPGARLQPEAPAAQQDKLVSFACCVWKFGGFQSPLTSVPEGKTGPLSCPRHFTHSQGVRLLAELF